MSMYWLEKKLACLSRAKGVVGLKGWAQDGLFIGEVCIFAF